MLGNLLVYYTYCSHVHRLLLFSFSVLCERARARVYLLLWYANLTTRPRTGLSLPSNAPSDRPCSPLVQVYPIHSTCVCVCEFPRVYIPVMRVL